MEQSKISQFDGSVISNDQVRTTYNIYSHLYDVIFGLNLNHGRKQAIKMMDPKPSQSILEIGIGTGISLKYYNKDQHIVGIDLSEGMLKKAQHKVSKYGLTNTTLQLSNAENLLFPNDHFDKVVVMYVYSVTENPLILLDEAKRVCKHSGDIYIVNHFSNYDNSGLTWSERLLKKHSGRIGFRSDFSYDEFILEQNLDIQSVRSVNFMGLSRIVHFKK